MVKGLECGVQYEANYTRSGFNGDGYKLQFLRRWQRIYIYIYI